MNEKNTCGTCGCTQEDGEQLFCHRLPPIPIAVPTVHPITGQPGIGIQAVHPAVQKDNFCSEWHVKTSQVMGLDE